ncbi:sialate O-acetylesterase [Halomicrococcus gelatinilyticus]|uniref:sialate O-acetylesterase n=1 Tax=Halomicrococcus gelatinilyticus TaxID=1702103 RepID=UPI0038996D63
MVTSRRRFLSAAGTIALAGCTAPKQQDQQHPGKDYVSLQTEPSLETLKRKKKPTIDLFIVGGQSNAVGKGNRSNSPNLSAETAIKIDPRASGDARLKPLRDPIRMLGQKSSTGSAWPSFAKTYTTLTDRHVAIIGAAKGGTAQHADADLGYGNWDTGGLTNALIDRTGIALDALQDSGFRPQIQGVLWHQGERDAQAINNGKISQEDYLTALQTMVKTLQSRLGSHMPFWLFQVGKPASDSNISATGFQKVASAQAQAANDDSEIYLASTRQQKYSNAGLQTDSLHYNQFALNIMGRVGAITVTSVLHDN